MTLDTTSTICRCGRNPRPRVGRDGDAPCRCGSAQSVARCEGSIVDTSADPEFAPGIYGAKE